MSNIETKKTLTAVDRSTKALALAAETLKKAVADLGAMVTTSNQLAQEIEFKENELTNLVNVFANKEREQKAELALRIKENGDKVTQELMKARDLAEITNNDLTVLRQELKQAITSKAVEVAATAEAVTANVRREESVRYNELVAKHAVDIAQKDAKLGAAEERNAFLVAQIEALNRQIVAERDARIEIAKAESARQGVVVNTSGK